MSDSPRNSKCNDGSNNQNCNDASGAFNQDLYQWNGDNRQSGPAPRNSGQQPDLYQYDGAGRSNGAGCKDSASSSDCNWRPDPEARTPLAQAWMRESDKQRAIPMQLDQNGDYTVQFGDCLSTIAERELKREGTAVNRDSIRGEMQKLIDANVNEHPSLGCNPDLVKTGWKLHIPGATQDAPPPEQPRQPEKPPEQQRPQPDCPEDDRCVPRPPRADFPCPPRYPRPDFDCGRGPVIINNYINADNLYINQSGGGRYQMPSYERDCPPQYWGRQSAPRYQDYSDYRAYSRMHYDDGSEYYTVPSPIMRRQGIYQQQPYRRIGYNPADMQYDGDPQYSDAQNYYRQAPQGFGPQNANPYDFTSTAYSPADVANYRNAAVITGGDSFGPDYTQEQIDNATGVNSQRYAQGDQYYDDQTIENPPSNSAAANPNFAA